MNAGRGVRAEHPEVSNLARKAVAGSVWGLEINFLNYSTHISWRWQGSLKAKVDKLFSMLCRLKKLPYESRPNYKCLLATGWMLNEIDALLRQAACLAH